MSPRAGISFKNSLWPATGFTKAVFHWFYPHISTLAHRAKIGLQHSRLGDSRFRVKFPHDKNLEFRAPSSGLMSVLLKPSGSDLQLHSFASASRHEPLLRELIVGLLNKKDVEAELNIIDIGSWVGDNALPWAKLLKKDACVISVDPSAENLAFQENMALLNSVRNILLIEGICSDTAGATVSTSDSLSHATFRESSGDSDITFSTTTLDLAVPEEKKSAIGLLHVDVEGFELQVLRGARGIIESSLPVVVYERHLSDGDVDEVREFLGQFGYAVYMINEVIQGNNLDCRNFIAFANKSKDSLSFDTDSIAADKFWKATPGPNLIPA